MQEPTRNEPWQAVTVLTMQLPAVSQHAPGQGFGLQVVPLPRNVPWQAAAVVTSVQLPEASQHAPGHGLGVQLLAGTGVPPWCWQKVNSTR